MVIMLGIGQSAVRLPNSAKLLILKEVYKKPWFLTIGYGSPSTTERVSVNDEGLISPSLLKIQSGPLRKFGDSRREMR